MQGSAMLRQALAVGVLMLCAMAARADEYALDAFALSATTPVEVTVGAERGGTALYVAADGEWRPLQMARGEGVCSFVVPADTGAETIVLMDKPAWLTLPDTDPPVAGGVTVGGATMELADGYLDLGRVGSAPEGLTVSVADALNPIPTGGVAAYVDGRELSAAGGAVDVNQSADGKEAEVALTLPELPDDKHVISLLVADATPRSNQLELAIAFDTSPLLRNAGFEEGGGARFATHWRHAAWGRNAETSYETVVAEGEGRTGNAVRLKGIAGSLYLIVGQTTPLTGGQTYVFSGWYRTEADQEVGVSLYGAKAEGLDQQYTESDPLPPSTDWAPFEWEVLAGEGHPEYEVFVWSKSKGNAWFDDLDLRPKQ